MESIRAFSRSLNLGAIAKATLSLLLATCMLLLMQPVCANANEPVDEEADSAPTLQEAQPELETIENELVVVYEDESVEVNELNASTSPDVEVVEKEVLADETDDGEAIDVVTVSDDTDIDLAVEELSENPKVAYVEPNYVFTRMDSGEGRQPGDRSIIGAEDQHPDGQNATDVQPLATNTNDPQAADQYYLQTSGFKDAWDRVKCNGSATVAVVDDGCMFEHPDLKANIDIQHAYDAQKKAPLQSAPSASNRNSHGTCVSGVVAAVADNGIGVAGASYNAKVLPVNVFMNNGTAAYSTIMEGLLYIERLVKANSVTDLRVVNMSFGVYSEDEVAVAMRDLLERLRYNYNILPVAAGGNGDAWGRPILQKSYPCDYDACMSVTSVDRWGSNSAWCDYNEYKDIAAPGEGIVTTSNNGGLTSADGTSLASPIVASGAALVYAANPRLTATQVENALKQTATTITGNAHPQSGSKGALNARAAVELALSGRGISNTPTQRSAVMHRLYNPNSGEHFYTASTYERDSVVRAGWSYEGTAWNAPLVGDPVYRMYNPNSGDHHYTPSAGERDMLVRVGWRYEGIGWYTSVAQSQPLYRLYNPNASTGTHHYTRSYYEATHLTFVGWRYEGIGWFGTDRCPAFSVKNDRIDVQRV